MPAARAGTAGTATHHVTVDGAARGDVSHPPTGSWLGTPAQDRPERLAGLTVHLHQGVDRVRFLKGTGHPELDLPSVAPARRPRPSRAGPPRSAGGRSILGGMRIRPMTGDTAAAGPSRPRTGRSRPVGWRRPTACARSGGCSPAAGWPCSAAPGCPPSRASPTTAGRPGGPGRARP
ncbi:hypothetical protein ACFQ1I_06040 [Kitasatospora arboriphila]